MTRYKNPECLTLFGKAIHEATPPNVRLHEAGSLAVSVAAHCRAAEITRRIYSSEIVFAETTLLGEMRIAPTEPIFGVLT